MKITINTHSIVDVITNSSSEIFTIETTKTKDFLADAITQFCTEKKLNYSVSASDIDFEEDIDDDLRYMKEHLAEKGYEIVRVKERNPAYVIKIDRDEIYLKLSPLKNFLIETFNATVDYD